MIHGVIWTLIDTRNNKPYILVFDIYGVCLFFYVYKHCKKDVIYISANIHFQSISRPTLGKLHK